MTIDDNIDHQEENEGDGRGKKGKRESDGVGAIGQTKAPVSEAALDLMKKFGLPKERIAEILRTWAHLVGDQLVRRLAEFAREGVARASAHLHVQFDLKGGFAVVTNFLSSLVGHNLFGLKSKPDQHPPSPH